MDAFSEILNGVKLNGALYFNAEFSAPWGASTPAARALAPALAPGAQHLMIYHFILDGRAFARLGGASLALEPGDVIIFPHGDPHLMSSETCILDPELSSDVERKIMTHDLSLLRGGGGGETTRIVCGYMACDPQLSRPVLSGLPPMFKVNIRADRAGYWLEHSILHLVDEAGSETAGSQAMLAKLSEALFVDTLRRYMESLPESQTGWLAGARDATVGKSLALLHHRVEHPWTIAELADHVGVSRSTLVERFTRYLGEPPMTYLSRWRLQLAARSLRGTSKGVAEIACEVGYESEAAFNRAFKREFGLPPARYRREKRDAASSAASA
jgi:AraC-like DNA-binding protein